VYKKDIAPSTDQHPTKVLPLSIPSGTMITKGLLALGTAVPALAGSLVQRQSSSLEGCPGYTASNLQDDGSRVTADLSLAGAACNVYGEDLTDLKLEVEYQTGTLRWLRYSSALC
jgi:hypothetical protein